MQQRKINQGRKKSHKIADNQTVNGLLHQRKDNKTLQELMKRNTTTIIDIKSGLK